LLLLLFRLVLCLSCPAAESWAWVLPFNAGFFFDEKRRKRRGGGRRRRRRRREEEKELCLVLHDCGFFDVDAW
jgi:hypothetical protein